MTDGMFRVFPKYLGFHKTLMVVEYGANILWFLKLYITAR